MIPLGITGRASFPGRTLRLAVLISLLAVLLAGCSDRASAQARDRAADAPAARQLRSAPLPESLRDRLGSLRPEERNAVRRRLTQMPQQRRQRFFRRWRTLDEKQRDAVFERWQQRLSKHMDRGRSRGARDDDRVGRNRRAWREMQPEKRDDMRLRLKRFGRLGPEKQRAVVERRFSDRPEAEREEILERLRAAASHLAGSDRPRVD